MTHSLNQTFYETVKVDKLVKSRIVPFIWIPACAGMTLKKIISSSYAIRHTREGGYPGVKMTFYEIVKVEDLKKFFLNIRFCSFNFRHFSSL